MKNLIKNILDIIGTVLLGIFYIAIILLMFAGAIMILVLLLDIMSKAGGWLGVVFEYLEFILKGITIVLVILIGFFTFYSAGEDFILEFQIGKEGSIPGYMGRKYREIKRRF